MLSYKQKINKKKKKSRRKLMNQITISLIFCLSCTRSITLLKKQITKEKQRFTGTVYSIIFKFDSALSQFRECREETGRKKCGFFSLVYYFQNMKRKIK